jgi:hypothetical protein
MNAASAFAEGPTRQQSSVFRLFRRYFHPAARMNAGIFPTAHTPDGELLAILNT